MNENQKYIHNVKMEDIPWNRLTTAYVRATEFPEYFAKIEEMSNQSKIKSTLHEILYNIEHQSTLWRATPFAMIFLARIFKKAVAEMNQNEVAFFIVKELLRFFELIAELFHESEQYYQKYKIDIEPLPYFGDMLKEEFLFPEECDDEEDEDMLWEEDVEKFCEEQFEKLGNSFYYYSYQVLLEYKETLRNIKCNTMIEQVNKLQDLLY